MAAHTLLDRAATEVVAEWFFPHSAVGRLVMEVIAEGEAPYTPIEVGVTRTAVEVLAAAAAYPDKHAEVGRFALETLGSADLAARGLAVNYNQTLGHWFMVLDLHDWGAGGQFVFYAGDSPRLTISGTSTTRTFRYTDGASSIQATAVVPVGPVRLSIRISATPATSEIRVNGVSQALTTSGSSWSPVTITRVQGSAPTTAVANAELAELLVYSAPLSDAQRNYVEAYLTCKWFTPGCNPFTDLGPAP